MQSELLSADLMNGEVGRAKIAQQVKIVFQPLLSSITQCSGKPLFFPVPVLTNFWPPTIFFCENATD